MCSLQAGLLPRERHQSEECVNMWVPSREYGSSAPYTTGTWVRGHTSSVTFAHLEVIYSFIALFITLSVIYNFIHYL